MAQRILRPMGYVDLLDETFDLYRRNFLLFFGIAAVVLIPMSLVTYALGEFAAVVSVILLIPLHYVVIAAATWAVSQCYLGKKATIASSYQAIARRAISFLLTMLLASIMIGFGFLLLIIPGVIFCFWYAFISEVFIVEGKSYSGARNRSKELAAGHWGRIFVVGCITILITTIVQYVFTLPLAFVLGFGIGGDLGIGGMTGALYGLVEGLASALSTPILVIAFVLLYYDIRVRKEGFDLQLLAENLGETPESPVALQEEVRPL